MVGEGQERKSPEVLGQLSKGLVSSEKAGQLIKLLKDDEIFSVTVGDVEVNTLCMYVLCIHACVSVITEHFTHSQ